MQTFYRESAKKKSGTEKINLAQSAKTVGSDAETIKNFDQYCAVRRATLRSNCAIIKFSVETDADFSKDD